MSKSETLTALAKALSTFQGAMRSIPKTSTNPFFHSKYADLDAVWEICRKPLSDNGFALVQTTVEDSDKLYLETLLIHTSGEYISSLYPITPMRQTKDQGWVPSDDPQSIGSAITYARRYAMSAMLGLSAEEDDDAERAQKRAGPANKPATRTEKAPTQGEGHKAIQAYMKERGLTARKALEDLGIAVQEDIREAWNQHLIMLQESHSVDLDGAYKILLSDLQEVDTSSQ